MVVNIERLFSKRATRLRASEIRELLKITQIPGMISFAGGLPNPSAFPVKIIHHAPVFTEVLSQIRPRRH